MPVADPSSGRVFVWLISCFLFTSVAAGGSFLVLYMVLPPTPSTSWLPIAGVSLVCLPWLFWLITFFYRIISRALGFRVVVGSGGGGGGGRARTDVFDAEGDGGEGDGEAGDAESVGGREGRKVQFGGAVVIGEGAGGGCDEDERRSGSRRVLSASNSSNDISVTSHESELPLTSAMAS